MVFFTHLVFWMLVVTGFTQIVCVSLIMKPFREWSRWPYMIKKLLLCPLCMGFWAGILFSVIGLSPAASLITWDNHLYAFLDALAASAVCWFAHVVLLKLGSDKL